MLSETGVMSTLQLGDSRNAYSVPGSRPNHRHRTTSPHMNEPSNTLDRQAAHIAEEATMMNLEMVLYVSLNGDIADHHNTYSAEPEGRGGIVGR